MAVNYGQKVSVPDFKKGSDTATAAVAIGYLDPDFFKPSDFEVDCDGCTACCKGDDGPRINDDEREDYACHVDEKGEWRLDQVDGHCVYLGPLNGAKEGCLLHYACDIWESIPEEQRKDESHAPLPPPRICRDFDCRSIIIKFNDRGLDQLVNSKQLPIDVVIQGRAKLKQFNDMINTRASVGKVDLSALLMTPAEEADDAHDSA